MDMDYENKPVESIGDWYQLFRGDNTAGTEVEKPAAPSNTVGELLIDAIKLRKYANFISEFATSIEQDISADITADIASTDILGDMTAPISPVPTIQPLKLAANRREVVVKYAEELTALINTISGILSRVKFKEQQ